MGLNKTEVVREWAVLKTVTDVRNLLSITNNKRKVVPKNTHIARPLNELVLGHNASKKNPIYSMDKRMSKGI